MQYGIQKHQLSGLEKVLLVILAPIIYVVAFWFLLHPIGNALYMPHGEVWISTWMAFLIVLAFDVAWVLSMRSWPVKNLPRRLRIYLTVFVFTLSASVLTCFVGLDMLEACFA